MAEWFGFYKKYLQRRSLRKDASTVPTGLLPISRINTLTAILDGEKRDSEECKAEIMYFCRVNDIRLRLFFFNFNRIESGERLITSITNTVLRKDLKWRGTFKEEKQHLLFSSAPDMLLILTPLVDFTVEYTAKCSRALFKVGRVQLPGQTFDLVVADPADKTCTQTEAFRTVKNILNKIS